MFKIVCRVHDDNLPNLSAPFIVRLRFYDKYLSLSFSSDVKFEICQITKLDFFSSSVTSFLTMDIYLCKFKGVSWFGLKQRFGSLVFAIAYAADILKGNNVYDLIYGQTKMREHLIACFEQRKITTFPLYEKRNTEKVVTYKETSSPWNQPRCSARLK